MCFCFPGPGGRFLSYSAVWDCAGGGWWTYPQRHGFLFRLPLPLCHVWDPGQTQANTHIRSAVLTQYLNHWQLSFSLCHEAEFHYSIAGGEERFRWAGGIWPFVQTQRAELEWINVLNYQERGECSPLHLTCLSVCLCTLPILVPLMIRNVGQNSSTLCNGHTETLSEMKPC